MTEPSPPLQQTLPKADRDLLPLHRSHPSRYPFLLESVAHGTPQARYNILFAYPTTTLSLRAGRVLQDGAATGATEFLNALDAAWQQARTPPTHSTLPFRGGWFLFLGYELAAEIEPSLQLPAAQDGLPTAYACRCEAAIIQDLEAGVTHLLARDAAQLQQLHSDYHTAYAEIDTDSVLSVSLVEEAPARHHAAVERTRRYILDGDLFQANLSRLWQGELQQALSAAELYARLRKHNPAPFAGLAHFEGADIISSSPERLVEVRGGRAQTRPIAGTRRRLPGRDDDTAIKQELLRHPKERAEHIMLIDLERNDLGRIAVPGSVEVNELMVLESYAHVHHIVSNVRAQLRSGVTPGQVIRALFPGGTITGCPKVRCMEVIAELEGEGRGAYTGSMGYLNDDGDMDLNILIRTIVKQGPTLRLRAGGGIVADSQPQAELQETRAKARGMIHALGMEVDDADPG